MNIHVEGEPGDWVVVRDGVALRRYKYRADAEGYAEAIGSPRTRTIILDRPGAGEASGIQGRRS